MRAPVRAIFALCCSAIAARAVTLSRFPYLQNMRADGVSVLWATRECGTGAVQYSSDNFSFFRRAEATRTLFPASQTKLAFNYCQYQAELEPLRAGIEYFYRVTVDTGNGPELLTPPISGVDLSFRAPVAAGDFTFMALGDSGSGSAEQQSLTARLLQEKPALVLHAGDIAYEEGTYDQFQSYYFSAYFSLMARVPFFPAVGNHEYETDLAAPYLAMHSLPASGVPLKDRGRYYSFDWGNAHFVSLDSNTPLLEAAGGSGGMLDWFEKDLQRTTKYWKIVYFHHAPHAVGNHEGDDTAVVVRNRIVPILDRYNVQLVINGHEHSYQRTQALRGGQVVPAGQGTVYITTGGGGGRLYPVALPLPSFVARALPVNHYLMVDVRATSIVLRAIGADGRDIDNFTLRPAPAISSGGVVNAATFDAKLAPGTLVSIFGRNLAPVNVPAPGFPLPTTLGTVQVSAAGRALPLLFASPYQVNTQLPFDSQTLATLRVTTPNGTTDVNVTLGETAPAILTTANDRGLLPAVIHANGSLVSNEFPAEAGEFLTVYMTGLGPLDGDIGPGQQAPSSPLLRARGPVLVTVGTTVVTPLFAGLSPGFAGLYQVNLQVPDNLIGGFYNLQVSSKGASSNVVTLPVRSTFKPPDEPPPQDPL